MRMNISLIVLKSENNMNIYKFTLIINLVKEKNNQSISTRIIMNKDKIKIIL